jgi:hypothetical protein
MSLIRAELQERLIVACRIEANRNIFVITLVYEKYTTKYDPLVNERGTEVLDVAIALVEFWGLD